MNTSENSNDEPRVYVGIDSKNNSDNFDGEWVSLEGLDKETFLCKCAEIYKDEHDPQFIFHDYAGFLEDFYSEEDLSDELWDWLKLDKDARQRELDEESQFRGLDEEKRELLSRYIEATGRNKADINEAQDAFAGTARNEAEFAANIAAEAEDIPKDLPSWIVIDWQESWEQNLRLDYSTSKSGGTVWFFRD